MEQNERTSISQAQSLREVGEFWDAHDFTEFDTDAPDIQMTVVRAIPIEAGLLRELQRQARGRGVSVETLVNVWLQQKLVAEHKVAA